MFNRNYTILPLWGWIVMLLSISAIFSANTLTDWGSIWSIVAGVIALFIFIYGICNWYSNKTRISHSIQIFYLIPKSHYESKDYPNAPNEEQLKSKLSIGIGKYQLLIKHHHKIALTKVFPLNISFEGDEVYKPKRFPLTNHPFVVGQRINAKGEEVGVDWHGNSLPAEYNGQYLPCADGMLPIDIETYGYWKGKLIIGFNVKESAKPITVKLPLLVSKYENKDEVPFLKTV
jgi:hypothetical protein